jgi:glucokinase
LRTGLYDAQCRLLTRHAQPTEVEKGRESVLERLIEQVRCVGNTEQASWDRIQAVGIAAPGPLDPCRGVIHWAPNLPGWHDVPLADRVSEAIGRPVFLGNDGNLAALAEQRCGAGQGYDDLAYITVSTGIGGGVISGGKLVDGHRGFGGEVGHMTMEPNGPRCNCGNSGCLESLASGAAIAQQARQVVEAGARTRIADLASGNLGRITARLVHEAAQQGDVVAIDLFRKAGMYRGIGVVNLLYLFNPAVVIVGGGVAKAGDLLFVPLRATVRQRIHGIYWQDCPIVQAALGKDVCLTGAAILAMEGIAAKQVR